MEETVKKKISGKKITLIIIASLLAALILAAGLFFGIMSCTGKHNTVSTLKEGYTVRKIAPADGSTPADHSGIDNIAFMAYVLDNQPFYHAKAENSTKATGYEQVTKTWKDYQSAKVNGTANNVMVCSDLSYSSLVKASTQSCFVYDGYAYFAGNGSAYMRSGNRPSKNSVPADIKWSGDQPDYYSAESYDKKYGSFSTELSVYVINENTLESAEEVIDNGDGTYSQKFVLNNDAACWYQYGMKTRGSLKSLPEFKKIEITFTFDGSWQVLKSYCEEKTDIAPSALGGMSMGSTSKTETVFDYSNGGFDETHFSQFNSYYEKYVGKDLSTPVEAPEEPALLDVLGGGFNKVVDPNGDGQKFALGLKLGETEYSGTAYAKLGDMGDILGSLDVRLALGGKDSGKQDLYVQFANGKLNLYYSEAFAMLADINAVSEAVSKISGWVSALNKVEAQDIAYALSEDNEENEGGLDLDSLLSSLSFTYDDTSASIALVTDDLLGLGIGLDVQIEFDRFKEEDGSTYAFRSFGLNSLSYKGTPINLSASLLPDDNAEKVSHNASEAPADLAGYLNGVYGLLNSNSYVVDIRLDGTCGIEYINGLTLNAAAQVSQTNGFDKITVKAPIYVEYGTLSIDLEANYTVNLNDGSFGTVYLWINEISGKTADVKVYCQINEVIDAVNKIIGFFTAEETDGEGQTPATQSDETADEEKVNAVAKIINLVLGLDYGKIITDLKADASAIGATINVDEILKSLDIDLGFNAGSVSLTLENGETATLTGTDKALGLTVKLSGSQNTVTADDLKGYADITAYVNGVYNLLNCNSVKVVIELAGTSEIEYLSGIKLYSDANIKLENGYDDITVSLPLNVTYGELSVGLEAFYTVNVPSGSYGNVYLNIVSVNGQPYEFKVYCNIDETVTAVKELITFIGSIGRAEEEEENADGAEAVTYADEEATDKIANIINAVININYGDIISELVANINGVSVKVNADAILQELSVSLGGLSLGELNLNLALDNNKTAILSGGLEKLALTVDIAGSATVLTAPEEDYTNVNEFIEIVRAAAEQAKLIIENKSIEFSVDNLALTLDGVKMSVNGYGEVKWENDKIRVAAEATFAITENDNGEEVKIVFVYDEASAPLVRFTVNGLGLAIYEEDITEISDLITKITEAVKSFTVSGSEGENGEEGNEENGAENGEENGEETDPVAALSEEEAGGKEGEAAEQPAIDFVKLLGAALDTLSKITVELRTSDIENADFRDIFIGYANIGKLTLSANGGLAIKLNIVNGEETEIADLVASVSAGTGANFNAINEKLDNAAFYEEETFVKEVYRYVLDLLDNLTVKSLLQSNTYTVDVAISGTDSGIEALNGIIINAHLYYTEVEENEKTNKLAEADIDLDIKGTKVVAKAYIYEHTIYISLKHIAGTDLTDIAFKADTDNIYEAAKTLVDVITSKTLAEIVSLFTAESADGNAQEEETREEETQEEIVTLGEEGKASLSDIIAYVLTLDFNDVISYKKVDGKNTLTVNPDGILEAFGVKVKIGTVKVAINPVTHSIEASVAGEKEWLTFNAQAVEGSEHGVPDTDTQYIDINFVSTLLEDLNTSLKYVEENSPEGEILFSLKTAEGEKINVDLVSISEIDIDDVTITVGLKADKSFYFTFYGHLNESKLGFSTVAADRYISVTYSDGYITMGRDVNTDGAIYKVMTLEYLIDNMMDKNNSPIRWLLGTSGTIWGLVSGVLNNIVKIGLDSGLTSTDEVNLYYLYGGSSEENGGGEQTPPEAEKAFSLSDYINGMSVKLGKDEETGLPLYTSNYGDASSALTQLGLNASTNYYAFDVKLSAITSAIKTLYAALLRNDNGGLAGLYAYADIAGSLKVTANISGGLTSDHAPDYREIVNEKYNVNYNNFDGQEYKTFGCYSSENNSYAASDFNRPYELTVYGYESLENYTLNQCGGKLLYSNTHNSGSIVYLLEDDVWLDSEHTVKLIYVDEDGNDMGSWFAITANTVIYQKASGKSMITLHSPYEEDREMEGFLDAALENPLIDVYDNGTPNDVSDDKLFAGWYADENYTVPVTSMQEGVTEYYARFLDRRYTADNGITYEFYNVADEADNIRYHYTAASFVNGTGDNDYSKSENVLKIAESINGFPVTAIETEAFKAKSLKKVIVPETVTRVGAEAFMDNKDMELAVFLAPSVYFAGKEWSGGNRFVFYGCGLSNNETITKLDLYFNNATSENDNTDWFGFKKDGRNYYYIGNSGHGGSRNGKYIDHTGTNVMMGSPWAYIEYEISGANGADLSALTSGIKTAELAQEEIEAYVLNAVNQTTKPNGYINAYTVTVSGGYEINENSFGYAYTVKIEITESLEPAWYQLTVQTNYNGNPTSVLINGNYEVISESENTVSCYVQAGAEITLDAASAEGGVYEFNGWNVNGENREGSASLTLTMYSEVTDIKAIWKAAENENIKVVSSVDYTFNGENYGSGESNVKAVIGDTLAKPEAAGFDFLGWAQEASDGTLALAENTFIESDTVATFYALWVASRDDVNFDLKGTTLTATVNEGEVCWYKAEDKAFANELANSKTFNVSTDCTALRIRMLYTVSATYEAQNTWVTYNRDKGLSPEPTTDSYDGKVLDKSETTGTQEFKMYEGQTMTISREWTNGLVIEIKNSDNTTADFFLYFAFYEKKILWSTSIDKRDILNNVNDDHYIVFEGGNWRDENENEISKNVKIAQSGNGHVFGCLTANGNASFKIHF